MSALFTGSFVWGRILRGAAAIGLASVLSVASWGVVSAGAPDGGDITPPVLVDASADRLVIDTSQAPQTVTFTLHITDDLSGVAGVHLELRHELGYNSAGMCQDWPRTPHRDVQVQCVITWPQYSAEGRWLVSWFALTDQVGNYGDGNMVDCVASAASRCTQYEYNERATPVIRSMEIEITTGEPGADPPLWLPLIVAS